MQKKYPEKEIRREAFDPRRDEEKPQPAEEPLVPPRRRDDDRLEESDLPGDPTTPGRD